MQSRTDYARLMRHGSPIEALLGFGNDTNLDGMAAEPVYVKVPDGKRSLRVNRRKQPSNYVPPASAKMPPQGRSVYRHEISCARPYRACCQRWNPVARKVTLC